MDLIVFDLDGTLLNSTSEISPFTKETLTLLGEKGIAYTLATGRTMLSAESILEGNNFDLPQAYNNGVTIWDPKTQNLILENLLSDEEISKIIGLADSQGITPFVHAIDDQYYFIYHAAPGHQVEKELISTRYRNVKAKIFPIEALPANAQVTNISMIGVAEAIKPILRELRKDPNLIAYSGPAIEGDQYRWMDILHNKASKGAAVATIKNWLGATQIICFGDSENDLSLFQLADESYAPENAKDNLKEAASAVIGPNYKDGVAHFLRERFSL
ncbi:MAG: haloacid dehalogenase [Gammaproteobacteria bacterium]|nr:haloacid dehalogenase [Gammaproteobacteria bacterium]|tara:strand:- start:660 stop:1478 length:819 start_codon:yes stop_codon:yes gene_type:complete